MEAEQLPRWPSVSADPTIVPCPLVIFILLQFEVVQFDYVCVLMVRRPINTDDKVSSVQFMAARHTRLVRRCLGIRVHARWQIVSETGVAGLVIR